MLYALDTETHLSQPGLAFPPVVCGAVADESSTWLLSPKDTLDAFWHMLSGGHEIVGAQLSYDLGVLCAAEPRFTARVFKGLAEGQFHDILIRQMLHWIYLGCVDEGAMLSPKNGQPLTTSDGQPIKRWGLAACSWVNLGRRAKERDEYRRKYASLQHIPIPQWPENARLYPQDDVRNTYDNFIFQKPFKNLQGEPLQVRADWAGQLAAAQGLRSHREAVQQVLERVEETYRKDMERFAKLGLVRQKKNGSFSENRKAVQERISQVYTAAGAPVPHSDPSKTFPEGQVSYSRDTMLESGDEALIEYARAGANKKLHSTYVPIILQGLEKPITYGFNVLVKTTRTSNFNPNFQNIPREGGIRETFKAPDGYVICSTDYGSLEMCTGAQSCIRLFNYSRLAEALNSGRDTHVLLAGEATGRTYDQMWDLAKVKKVLEAVNARQGAKAGNYGFWGLMGAAKFVLQGRKQPDKTYGPDGQKYDGTRYCILLGKDTICGREKVSQWGKNQDRTPRRIPPTCLACIQAVIPLKEAWYRAWPEAWEFHEWIKRAVKNGPALLEILGSGGLFKGGCGATDGSNLEIQGPAAIGAKDGFADLVEECFLGTLPDGRMSPLAGARPGMFVHDESIMYIPITPHMHEAAYRQAEIMREGRRGDGAMKRVCPDVKIEIEPALMERWYKKAEPVFINGRLEPWRPSCKCKADGLKSTCNADCTSQTYKFARVPLLEERRAA